MMVPLGAAHCREGVTTRPSMTVTVQVMVTSSPAVAAISDWSRVTLGGGRSGGGGGTCQYMCGMHAL